MMADAGVNKCTNNYSSWSKERLIERLLQLEAAEPIIPKTARKARKPAARQIKWDSVATRHVLLKFLYMGWDYFGYASQVDTTETIEEHIMSALKRCCLIRERDSSNYHRCGRTDAGVSAFTQVISIDLRSKHEKPDSSNAGDEYDYCKMLNRLLPAFIRCYAWANVDSNISSRFDCTSRSYNYFFPCGNLNVTAMQKAAEALVGSHDFRNLCKMDVGNGVTKFIRTIDAATIEPYNDDAKEFQMYKFTVKSRGFLWHQIRCIMAVLLLVGEEQEAPDIIKQLLDVEKTPCKPQYHMAIPLPLALSTADYDNIELQWNISSEEIRYVSGQLQGLWTEYATKATLLRESLMRIAALGTEAAASQWQRQKYLYSGIVSKTHTPLLNRATCQSLEEKIESVARKKRKVEDLADI